MHISWFDIGLGTVIAAFFLVVLIRSVFRLVRTLIRRNDPRYRMEISYRVFIVAFALVFFALPAYIEFRTQLANAYATHITRKVVGNNRVYVRCQRGLTDMLEMKSISFAGWVEGTPGTKKSNLNLEVCAQLSAWILSDKQFASKDQLFALHVVIHEAVHLTGEHNEAETEYRTTELFEDIIVSLGASPTEARRMNDYYKTQINPNQPSAYRVDFAAKEKAKREAEQSED